ncbi:hypothetical protein cypCar_00020623 [Cyprinus carpio]|nr:hypothetical protein cypCar_00020623 [Cyprinus carpio]
MEEFHSGDEVSFSPDEASNVVKECIEGIIGGVDYSQNKVNQWTASIVEHTLTQLVKQGKPFKYIGSCTVRWENRTMYCVVSVFAVAIAL